MTKTFIGCSRLPPAVRVSFSGTEIMCRNTGLLSPPQTNFHPACSQRIGIQARSPVRASSLGLRALNAGSRRWERNALLESSQQVNLRPGLLFPDFGLLIVVLHSQMRNQLFSAHPAQRVLQFHQLDEDVMLGVKVGSGHRGLVIERQ